MLLSFFRHVSLLTIILAIFALGTFIVIANSNRGYQDIPVAMEGTAQSGSWYWYNGMSTPYPTLPPHLQDIRVNQIYPVSVGDVVGVPGGYMQNGVYTSTTSYDTSAGTRGAYPYYNPEISAVDKREFLKVRYDASMRTRDVPGSTHRVETTVRNHDGRVDNSQSSRQSGYVSFVVPMNKYEAFRTEIEKLVGSRFLSVNIQSENLLPQKQSIEEQQKQADINLAESKKVRTSVVNSHATAIKNIQAQLEREAAKLASLRVQAQTPEILAQIAGVQDDAAALREALFNENATYKEQLSYADANIKGAQEWQSSVKTQDKTLADNVGTVSGSVSLQWISVWGIALLYLPGYWIPGIFALLSFLSYLWDTRRFVE